MILVYDSLTGNTRRFAERVGGALGLPVMPLAHYPGGDALLLTYTFGQGEVPGSTQRFLAQHAPQVRGVVSSGSYHWGTNFGRAGRRIAENWGIPLVAIINKAGSQADLERVQQWIVGQS
ncbi:class Ib ribonucleoside-diphosphate reductase assembly flavoprotein NrdI [Deinococcus sp. DB0503]|uniref:class Ib ribonucleoside-diphosphate reductase assembly flavoprotein NrdI n=1 Tax=Deinococcus sp. DB0503 TaxID=2479203 RepID=UPI0018E053AE|nr:class Ib ribonucleoside-diphosphate reductase assembly flavoprotein NrdI [Deinococcus sp. DB0503]